MFTSLLYIILRIVSENHPFTNSSLSKTHQVSNISKRVYSKRDVTLAPQWRAPQWRAHLGLFIEFFHSNKLHYNSLLQRKVTYYLPVKPENSNLLSPIRESFPSSGIVKPKPPTYFSSDESNTRSRATTMSIEDRGNTKYSNYWRQTTLCSIALFISTEKL